MRYHTREETVAARLGRCHRVDSEAPGHDLAVDSVWRRNDGDVRRLGIIDKKTPAAELPIPKCRIELFPIDVAEATGAKGEDRFAVGCRRFPDHSPSLSEFSPCHAGIGAMPSRLCDESASAAFRNRESTTPRVTRPCEAASRPVAPPRRGWPACQ